MTPLVMHPGPIGARAWAAAERLIGARFRLQGRDAATGLDCVGVVVAAYGAAGVRLLASDSYGLRGMALDAATAALDGGGLARCAQPLAAGDVGLFALPAGQLHLALLAPDRIIHADAALRRVVGAPAARLPPPVLRWRFQERI